MTNAARWTFEMGSAALTMPAVTALFRNNVQWRDGDAFSGTRICGRPFRPRTGRRPHRAEALCFVRSGFQPGGDALRQAQGHSEPQLIRKRQEASRLTLTFIHQAPL